MEDQSGVHRHGVRFPPTRRSLDIGEQERHRPRGPIHGPTLRRSVSSPRRRSPPHAHHIDADTSRHRPSTDQVRCR
jgi:hypothetical protein